MSKDYTGIFLISSNKVGESQGPEFNDFTHMEFGVDTTEHLDNLPLMEDNYKGYGFPAPWSLAKDAQTANVYYLDGPSNTWKKVGA